MKKIELDENQESKQCLILVAKLKKKIRSGLKLKKKIIKLHDK